MVKTSGVKEACSTLQILSPYWRLLSFSFLLWQALIDDLLQVCEKGLKTQTSRKEHCLDDQKLNTAMSALALSSVMADWWKNFSPDNAWRVGST